MDVSTRPSATRRQGLQLNKRTLAAFLFVTGASILPVLASQSQTDPIAPASPETVSSVAPGATQAVAITVVEPGEETIALTAHIADLQSDLATDLHWVIRNELNELVYEETATETTHALPPGLYFIEATYGSAVLREQLTLLEGNSLNVSFALGAGALRVLPMLKGITTGEMESRTLVYAMSGPDRGKLIVQSAVAGEVLKVRAGIYRVENRLGAGNTVAITDVRVKPGLISGIEVTHLGGVANLSFAGTPAAKVTWQVRDQGGGSIANLEGTEQHIALKPGRYVAEAYVGSEVLAAKFSISAGEERNILLGN